MGYMLVQWWPLVTCLAQSFMARQGHFNKENKDEVRIVRAGPSLDAVSSFTFLTSREEELA